MASAKQDIVEYLEKFFPPSLTKCSIKEVGNKGAEVMWHVAEDDLRPGGTVSGPTMMTLADLAMYIAILGEIGLVGLAVTTNMNINFLRKPAGAENLRGVCKLIKVGKALIVGEVWIYSENQQDEPVAHVTGTYSVPPQRAAQA